MLWCSRHQLCALPSAKNSACPWALGALEKWRRLCAGWALIKCLIRTFGADLTIMEEGYELLDRIQNGGVLPMITSCSPGWIKYCEHFYPEFLPNLSSCKSPHQMLGAIIKSYYAQKNGVIPRISIPFRSCLATAKKYEKLRDGEAGTGYPDVDAVLTTREFARMIKRPISISSTCRMKTLTMFWASRQAPASSSAQPAALWKRPSEPLPMF